MISKHAKRPRSVLRLFGIKMLGTVRSRRYHLRALIPIRSQNHPVLTRVVFLFTDLARLPPPTKDNFITTLTRTDRSPGLIRSHHLRSKFASIRYGKMTSLAGSQFPIASACDIPAGLLCRRNCITMYLEIQASNA